ncbi:alpha/beta hydrolase fold domain-containing protein [Mucilaginibacter sp.]|jgi:acetyl esterase/lipase|uniref:alpha/beta hydrolase fold domain-containing protein n=1 Tax=Mucilaginibacter sp. TaxID=1882438 RepID=UPI0035680CEE
MIRLILLVLFFLISLLAVFEAPAYYLWLLAVIVTEFPLIFITVVAFLLVTGIWLHKYQMASNIFGILALILFCSPIVRSYLVASTLKQNFAAAFGAGSANIGSNNLQKPLNFSNFFKKIPAIHYKTITYNTDKNAPLSLDFYPSVVGGKRPCVVVVHGGSWSSGDSKQLPELNSYLASAGYNVAAINYRMSPQYKTPAPVEDIKEVFAYLKNHTNELRIDTSNFVLLGRSAGAQIALLSAYTHPEPGLKGVVDFYGPADMVWGYSVPSNPLIMDSRLVMRNYIGGTYDKMPQKYADSSPIEFVNKQTVPTLIIHGDNDVLVSPIHSLKLNEKLKQNNIKHYLLRLPWATHGFDYNINGPSGQLSTYVVERFISTVTR